MEENKTYLAIDLKSFYASVECVQRGLNPLEVNLAVGDGKRTDKTICPAISPTLKAMGVPSRPRLFEVKQCLKEINNERLKKAGIKQFTGKSIYAKELEENPELEVDFILAPPQMATYMNISSIIYGTYLEFVAPEDVHVYSVDEVFIDITPYLKYSGLTAHEIALKMIRRVLEKTGITATAGIGTNLYLAKIAMDIMAKKMPPDKDGVRIAQLDERTFREKLWTHQPITSFWGIGVGREKLLKELGLFTMGDIARYSLTHEDKLYDVFGVRAELMIDHAWGYEPCTIKDIKSYKPICNSINTSQVLVRPYKYYEARIVLTEMLDQLSLDLLARDLVTKKIVLDILYDHECLNDYNAMKEYDGPFIVDKYGRKSPKNAHGTINLSCYNASGVICVEEGLKLFDSIINRLFVIRKISVCADGVIPREHIPLHEKKKKYIQLDIFEQAQKDHEEEQKLREKIEKDEAKQAAILGIKKKYGKNAIVKGLSYLDEATARERNTKVGGHRA